MYNLGLNYEELMLTMSYTCSMPFFWLQALTNLQATASR